jgi:sulfite oxidase
MTPFGKLDSMLVHSDDPLNAESPRGPLAEQAFTPADRSEEAQPPQRFGCSIPLEKALRPEVLLAFAMNGEPLPALHGAPVRVVVPGYIGARSVKWLQRIEVRADPFDGWFQDVVYRLLEPEQEPTRGLGMALGEVALNADVLIPDDGAQVVAGRVQVKGYAFAGGERHVARVDVSHDGGATWTTAELLDDLGRWAWRLWRTELELPAGEHELLVRAWDSAAASQPERPDPLWNPKGYANNAWGRIVVHAA